MMLINGQAATQIDARDRGLCYGDGLFETLAIINGQPRLWSRHMQRLRTGCDRLGITPPDAALLRAEVSTLCQGLNQNQTQQAVIKITVTRGQGGRGYRAAVDAPANRIIDLFDWPVYPSDRADGIHVQWCDTRLAMNPALAGIKHLNRLEQVLARNEWQDDGIAEGLMQDTQGHVIEGTMSNLFIVKDGRLLTARLGQCGVTGIMRQLICDDVIAHDVSVTETTLEKDDILSADEVFVCNSLIGLWPVKQLQDAQEPRRYNVGLVGQHVRALLDVYLRDDKHRT